MSLDNQNGYPQNPGYPQSYGYPQQTVYPQNIGYLPNSGYSQAGYPQQLNPQTVTLPLPPPPPAPARSDQAAIMEDMETAGGADDFAFSDKSIRRGFIRKVYAILTLQLLVTFGFMAILYFPPNVQIWVKGHKEFLWTAYGLSIAFFIVLVCIPNVRRKTPWNYIFLVLFTLCEGYLLGAICSQYDSVDVLKAVVTTIVLVVALTLFAFQTKIDFTLLSGVLFVCLIGLLMFGLMAAIFQSDFLNTLYAALGAVIFSIYIVVDTQMMMGGNHALSISPEEYIFAALNLYLDIVNLFLFLLRLITQ